MFYLDLESYDDVWIVDVTESVVAQVSAVAVGRRNASVLHHELKNERS